MSVSCRENSEVQLGELCERVTVGHVGPMADQYQSGGTPFLRSQDIEPFLIRTGAIKFIGEDFNKKLKKSALKKDDVVIVRTGYPGTAAVVPAELDGANCADLVILTPGPNLDSWFVAALLNSAWGRGAVAGNLVGVAQQHFNVGAAKSLRFRPPDTSIQQRIGGITRAFCDLIEVNARRVAILEEMGRRHFNEWFVHLLYPGHETVRFVEAPRLPQGWRSVRLSEIADVNSDTISTRNAPSTIQYIDISSVSPGTINDIRTINFADAPGRARRRVRRGDILWSTVRPNRRSYALLLQLEPDTIASTGFAVLRAKAVPWSYLYLAVTTDEFVAHLEGRARGSAYPAVVASDFEVAELRLPPSDLLERFDQHVGPMLELASILRFQAKALRTARDLLLPKLISGEIDLEHGAGGAEAISERAAAE